MAEIDHRYAHAGPGVQTDVAVDEGLRAYMLRVYNYMAAGIALTGLVAYVIFSYAVTNDPSQAAQTTRGALALRQGTYLTPFGLTIYASWLRYVIMFIPLGFVFLLAGMIYRMSVGAAQLAFWAFAAAMGLSLSWIFVVFTGQSIAQIFFI